MNYYTDKYESGLIKAYEVLFTDLRDTPVKYLEMGIREGGSLLWAKNFFGQGSTIQGLDMDINQSQPIDGVGMYQINQEDTDGLTVFGNTYGKFDIIIDDGSHVARLTQNTFNALYPFLNQGGKYIIEDWGAGYFPQWSHCIGMEKLVTDLVWEHCGAVLRPIIGGSYAIIEKV